MLATPNTLTTRLIPNEGVNPLLRDIGWVIVGVLLLAISAQFKVPMGPVPVTLQALVVLLIGGMYGWRLGGITVLAYVLDGVVLGAVMPGMPWFAGPNFAGYAFLSPTAGYLWGFVAAAAVVGWLTETLNWRNNLISLVAAMLIGMTIIYAAGLAFATAVYYPIIKGAVQDYATVWSWFAAPFLFADAMKVVIATGLIFMGHSWLKNLRG